MAAASGSRTTPSQLFSSPTLPASSQSKLGRDGMDSYMSVDTMVHPHGDAAMRAPPKKRTKKAQSCDPCRRRKLKCDRGWPCGACRDRSEQNMCTWEDGVVPENAGRDAQDSQLVLQKMCAIESGLERLLNRMDHMESRMADTQPRTSSSPPRRPELKRSPSDDASDPLDTGGLFGLTWQPAGVASQRRALLHMHSYVPGKHIIPLLLEVYEKELDWMREILPSNELHERVEMVCALSENLAQNPDYLQSLSRAEVMRLIYAEALLFSVFGLSLVFARDLNFNKLYLEHGSTPVHGRFFHEAQVGLSVLNVFEEPHMDFVICNMLLLTGICSIRPPSVGAGLLNHAIQVAVLLDLDVEPPASMPRAEAARRVQLFALLATHDWFCTTTTKRYAMIRHDPLRLPSVFGPPEKQSKYLSVYHQYKLSIAHLYSQSSVMFMPPTEDYSHTCKLHYETIELRKRMPKEWTLESMPDPGVSESTRHIHATLGSSALNFLLIRIHLHFYVRGWDDPRYQLSRDTCYESARSLLRTFRAAFSWKIPAKAGDTQGRQCDRQIPDEVSIAARMWWFCNWSVAAAILLVKHLTILNERNESPSWDSERESILQDLCIMSRLLHYLSPVTSVARDGYEAMQRVAAHALSCTSDAPSAANQNSFTHWAARIVQARGRCTSKDGGHSTSSAEPMSLLSNMMKSSEIISDRRSSDDGMSHSDESPQSHGRMESLSSTPSFSAHSSSNDTHTVEMPVYGANVAQDVPSTSDADLDTFWAKFALPTLDVPPVESMGTVLDIPSPATALLGMPAPAVPNAYEWPADLSGADSTVALQQKDRLAPSQFNFPMGSLGPLTDDFIKSFESYSKRFATEGTLSM